MLNKRLKRTSETKEIDTKTFLLNAQMNHERIKLKLSYKIEDKYPVNNISFMIYLLLDDCFVIGDVYHSLHYRIVFYDEVESLETYEIEQRSGWPNRNRFFSSYQDEKGKEKFNARYEKALQESKDRIEIINNQFKEKLK